MGSTAQGSDRQKEGSLQIHENVMNKPLYLLINCDDVAHISQCDLASVQLTTKAETKSQASSIVSIRSVLNVTSLTINETEDMFY